MKEEIPQDRKSENMQEEVNENISQEQTIEQTIENYQSTLFQQSQDNLRNALNDAVDFKAYSSLYSNVAHNPLPDVGEIKSFLFISNDKTVLNKYFNVLFQYLRVIVQHKNAMITLRGKTIKQLEYFKKKYHFE